MVAFPVDAPIEKVIKAFRRLGFRPVREGNHIAVLRENADGVMIQTELENPPDRVSILPTGGLYDRSRKHFTSERGSPSCIYHPQSRTLALALAWHNGGIPIRR